jgi:hypothetical protein
MGEKWETRHAGEKSGILIDSAGKNELPGRSARKLPLDRIRYANRIRIAMRRTREDVKSA